MKLAVQKLVVHLKILEQRKIPYRIRQVIIPTINDTEENIKSLKKITENLEYLEKIETTPLKDGISLYDFLKRPEITLEHISHFVELPEDKEVQEPEGSLYPGARGQGGGREHGIRKCARLQQAAPGSASG